MNQVANIAAAVKSLFLAHPTLPTLCPGGLIFGLEKAGAQRPFCSMQITLDGEPEWQTGTVYCQDYRLAIRVWSTEALGQAGTIQEALRTLLTSSTKLDGLTDNAWTLAVWPEPAAIEQPEERYQGQFTFVAGATWQIQLQETRA